MNSSFNAIAPQKLHNGERYGNFMRARHGIKAAAEMSSLSNSVQNDEAATSELHFSRVVC